MQTWRGPIAPQRDSRSEGNALGKISTSGLTKLRHFGAQQYTAAVKTSSLEPTSNALNRLGALFAKDPKLATILEAPTLSGADKSAIIAELEKNIGANAETVNNFLHTLAENNRLSLLGGVVTKFSELMSAARGEVEMTVTSATVRGPGGTCR